LRREVFQTPGPLALELRMPAGEIQVQAGERAETIVELDTSSSREDVLQAIEEARIELRRRGDGQGVVVDVRPRRRFGITLDRGDIRMRVICPHDVDVEVSTASADVELQGRLGGLSAEIASGDLRGEELNGRVEVKSASGDVQLDLLGGDTSIATASGDIYVRAVHGDATLRSASGDVRVDEAADSITVQTASGDQRIGSVTVGRVTLQSASGDQQVGIRRGSAVHLDVRTMSGDATSELEVRDRPLAVDAPLVELRATSMSGDIRIHRA
jgi:Putative adhesin